MGIIRKEVTGSTEKMKLVRNAKGAPTTATGGTKRTSFTGSNDTRGAGPARGNRVLKEASGYIDQADVTVGDTSHSRSFTKAGSRGSTAGRVTVAREDVTKGMGGRVIKDMR
jgi:hypothetical protein